MSRPKLEPDVTGAVLAWIVAALLVWLVIGIFLVLWVRLK